MSSLSDVDTSSPGKQMDDATIEAVVVALLLLQVLFPAELM